MRKTEVAKIHFPLLVIGTVFYLFCYPGLVTIHNGKAEANVLDIAAFCKYTMFYMIFVALLFGHALLWRSLSSDTRSDDKSKEGDIKQT